ncbi:MAG: energy transducer TonB [Mariniphaga sp.]|nr:energy transducer TonB [Mariniphaga sp.]
MEQKKTSKANLENKKSMFFMFGLLIVLGAILLAFEWSTAPKKAYSLGSVQIQAIEEEIIPITREPEAIPPQPPPQVVEVLNIVADDMEIEVELEIETSDVDDGMTIDFNSLIITGKEEPEPEDQIFYIVEEPAEFPGGERALYKYISDQVKYPVIAQENGIQGKVYVKFVVNEEGVASGAEILRGVDPSLNQEALRVINSLPNFKPGKQRGRPVKVYYNALINFQLQ